jgi:hypothetical protein
VLTQWNRHQVWKILTAIVVIWIVSGTALHFAERGSNPAFETWRESLWNVWVTLFSGLNSTPNTPLGRLVVSGVLVVGVARVGEQHEAGEHLEQRASRVTARLWQVRPREALADHHRYRPPASPAAGRPRS